MTATSWNASTLQGDAIEAVTALKDQPGESLLKFGTGSFSRALMQNGLIDELPSLSP